MRFTITSDETELTFFSSHEISGNRGLEYRSALENVSEELFLHTRLLSHLVYIPRYTMMLHLPGKAIHLGGVKISFPKYVRGCLLFKCFTWYKLLRWVTNMQFKINPQTYSLPNDHPSSFYIYKSSMSIIWMKYFDNY